jgi:hypothetical protein
MVPKQILLTRRSVCGMVVYFIYWIAYKSKVTPTGQWSEWNAWGSIYALDIFVVSGSLTMA